MNCIFCNIRDKKIKTDFLYEDDDVMAFRDIHPAKPVHILVIPKAHIEDFLHLDDNTVWDKMRTVAQQLAKENGLGHKGFKIVINAGGAQDIRHVHMHVLGPLQSAAL